MTASWNVLSPQGVGSALSYLEKRQEWVLSQVGRLQERVRALGQRMGISPTDIGVIQQVCCYGTTWWVFVTLFPGSFMRLGIPAVPWSFIHQGLDMVGRPGKSLRSLTFSPSLPITQLLIVHSTTALFPDLPTVQFFASFSTLHHSVIAYNIVL